jgi:hypothetical protein
MMDKKSFGDNENDMIHVSKEEDYNLHRTVSMLSLPPKLEEWDESNEMKSMLYYYEVENCTSEIIENEEQILNNISKHIVVCNLHSSIEIFIKAIRVKMIGVCPYMVILTNKLPSEEIWSEIKQYKNIIIIQGSPLKKEDIIRAKIDQAIKAVILNSDLGDNANTSDDLRDAETLFIYKIIQSVNPELEIICEIIKSTNVQYLQMHDKYQSYDMPDMYPLFCSGSVYFSSIIDTLTGQAYYNPFIVKIIQQILTGICENFDSPSYRDNNSIWIINIPVDYVNKKFKELFCGMIIHQDVIPLGLYREPGASDNEYPYVYTNPDPDVRITMNDKLICLSKSPTNQLQKMSTSNLPTYAVQSKAPENVSDISLKAKLDRKIKFVISDINSSIVLTRQGRNAGCNADE